jgi:hypothetical protein
MMGSRTGLAHSPKVACVTNLSIASAQYPHTVSLLSALAVSGLLAIGTFGTALLPWCMTQFQSMFAPSPLAKRKDQHPLLPLSAACPLLLFLVFSLQLSSFPA